MDEKEIAEAQDDREGQPAQVRADLIARDVALGSL